MDSVALGRRGREHHVGPPGLVIALGAPRHRRRGARLLLRVAAPLDRGRRGLAVRGAPAVGGRGRHGIRRPLPARATARAARNGGDRRRRLHRAAARHIPGDRGPVARARDRSGGLAHPARAAPARRTDAPALVVGLRGRARARELPVPVHRTARPGARDRRRRRAPTGGAGARPPPPFVPARLGGRSPARRPDRRGRRAAARPDRVHRSIAGGHGRGRARSAVVHARGRRPRGVGAHHRGGRGHPRWPWSRVRDIRRPPPAAARRRVGRGADNRAPGRRRGRLARIHAALPRVLRTGRGDADRDHRRRAPAPVDAGHRRRRHRRPRGSRLRRAAHAVLEERRDRLADGRRGRRGGRRAGRRDRVRRERSPVAPAAARDARVPARVRRTRRPRARAPLRRDRRAVGCHGAARGRARPPRGRRSRGRGVAEPRRGRRRRRDAATRGIQVGRACGDRVRRGDGLRARAEPPARARGSVSARDARDWNRDVETAASRS